MNTKKVLTVSLAYLLILTLYLLPARYPTPFGEVDAAWHHQEMQWILENQRIPDTRPDLSVIQLFEDNAYNYPPLFHALTATLETFFQINAANSLNIISGILTSFGFLFLYLLAEHLFKDWKIAVLAGLLGMTVYGFMHGFLWGQLPHSLGVCVAPLLIYLFLKNKKVALGLTGILWYLSPLAAIFVYLIAIPTSSSKKGLAMKLIIPTLIGLPMINMTLFGWQEQLKGVDRSVQPDVSWMFFGVPKEIIQSITGFPPSYLDISYIIGYPLLAFFLIGLVSLTKSRNKKFFLALLFAQLFVPRVLSVMLASEYPFRMEKTTEHITLALITCNIATLGSKKIKTIILIALVLLLVHQVRRAGTLMYYFYPAEPPWVGVLDDIRFTTQTLEALDFIGSETPPGSVINVVGFMSVTEIGWMQALTNRVFCQMNVQDELVKKTCTYKEVDYTPDYYLVTYDSYAYTRQELKENINRLEVGLFEKSKPLFVNDLTGVYPAVG